jgi:hypothetical protein
MTEDNQAPPDGGQLPPGPSWDPLNGLLDLAEARLFATLVACPDEVQRCFLTTRTATTTLTVMLDRGELGRWINTMTAKYQKMHLIQPARPGQLRPGAALHDGPPRHEHPGRNGSDGGKGLPREGGTR